MPIRVAQRVIWLSLGFIMKASRQVLNCVKAFRGIFVPPLKSNLVANWQYADNNIPENELIIIDPGFMSHVGHHYDYNKYVCQAAQRAGHSVEILAHRSLSPEEFDIPVRNLFSKSYYSAPLADLSSKLLYPISVLIYNLVFFWNLRSEFRHRRLGNTTLFVHTLDHNQFAGLMLWLLLPGVRVSPRSVVLLWRISYAIYKEQALYRHILIMIKAMFWLFDKLKHRWNMVCLATDTGQLRQEYQQYTASPITVYPIPHSRTENSNAAMDVIVADFGDYLNGQVVFSFLGDARQEKGYHLIFPALEKIADYCRSNGLVFWLQSNMSIYAAQDPVMMKAITQFDAAKYEFVFRHGEALTSEEYSACVNRTDVILLPYDSRNYYARSSGILMEALSVDKFVVVSENTWMSDQITEGVNGVSFQFDAVDKLAEAIKQAHQDYNKNRVKRMMLQQKWNSFHNADTLVKYLLR